MPDCYLLAVSTGSSLDRYSNNWSLFTLVEQVQLNELPANLPFEIHTYWKFDPTEFNDDFEMRLVLVRPPGETVSEPLALRSPTARFRLRATGLPVQTAGDCELRVEWRRQGHESWERCHVFWPFSITVVTEPESQAQTG